MYSRLSVIGIPWIQHHCIIIVLFSIKRLTHLPSLKDNVDIGIVRIVVVFLVPCESLNLIQDVVGGGEDVSSVLSAPHRVTRTGGHRRQETDQLSPVLGAEDLGPQLGETSGLKPRTSDWRSQG